MIEEMLAYNREFVRSKGYEKFQTSKFPDKKIAILTCMDTRLVELLPAALGIRNGDVKLIKNAGGMITGPFDSAVRSLLVGIIELGVEEVMVIGHTDCGVAHINADMMIRHLIQRGVSQDHIDMMRYCGIDFEAWLRGFDCVENSVGADMVAQAALVELHVVHIVQDFQVWGADEPGQLGGRAGMAEEVAGMVRGDVQRLQIDPDTASFRPFRRDFQRVEHGTELHGVAEVVVGAKDPSSLPQTV